MRRPLVASGDGTMTVRRLREADGEVLGALLRRFHGADGVDPRSFLRDPRCLAWVAEVDESVVGWCWAHELHRPDGRIDLLVYELEVAAELRGRGHGRALASAALKMVAERGYGKAWLLTDPGNDAAEHLYRSLGGEAVLQVLYAWPSDAFRAPGPVAK